MVGHVLGEVRTKLLGGVGDTQNVNEKLGKFKGTCSNLLCPHGKIFVALMTSDHGLLVPQGCHAGT